MPRAIIRSKCRTFRPTFIIGSPADRQTLRLPTVCTQHIWEYGRVPVCDMHAWLYTLVHHSPWTVHRCASTTTVLVVAPKTRFKLAINCVRACMETVVSRSDGNKICSPVTNCDDRQSHYWTCRQGRKKPRTKEQEASRVATLRINIVPHRSVAVSTKIQVGLVLYPRATRSYSEREKVHNHWRVRTCTSKSYSSSIKVRVDAGKRRTQGSGVVRTVGVPTTLTRRDRGANNRQCDH